MGRENELAQLAQLYRDARERERLALLEGPSGSGKSRILQELSRRIRLEGGVVLEGRCEQGHAFGPFATIVDRALSFLGDMSLRPSIELADLGCFEGCHPLWHQHELSQADGAQGSREARERRLIDAQNTIYSVKRLIGRPFGSPEVTRARERFPFTIEPGPSGGALVSARQITYTLAEISAFVLREIKRVDPGFDADSFLSGARIAYEMIVVSFANGDTDTLKPLLDASTNTKPRRVTKRRIIDGKVSFFL